MCYLALSNVISCINMQEHISTGNPRHDQEICAHSGRTGLRRDGSLVSQLQARGRRLLGTAGRYREKSYRGKYGYPCPVDGQVRDFKADTLAGVLAPGGWAPDKIRRDPAALELVRQVNAAGGLVATICHG